MGLALSQLTSPQGAAYAADLRATPQWAVDPGEPGPQSAGHGRSLFDEVTQDGVPFPFEALVRQVERRIGCAPLNCVSAVLIPLGRSLQRMSAVPEFFESPRVVVAVTGEGRGPVFARQRLYLGYQPRAALLEVISYNDAAGRFEFQLVHDYRAGGRPRTVAARRDVCVACHQNHAPIFSRPLWEETNANPAIAARLLEATARSGSSTGSAYGIEIRRGVDVPNAIDDATDAANLFAVTQRLWREACDAECRGAAVRAAFEYRLSGGRHFEPVPTLVKGFAARWPDGLAIPNPDLPNRNPLAMAGLAAAPRVASPSSPAEPPDDSSEAGAMQAHVAAPFEGLMPRAPLERWTASDPYLERRFVLGVAAFIAEADLAAIRRDAAAARARLAAHAWSDGSIGRGLLREALGLEPHRAPTSPAGAARTITTAGDATSPTAVHAGKSAVVPLPPELSAFVAPCASCHATAEHTPPNFLAGSAERVATNLRHCAPRLYVRLAMWKRAPAQWAKVPMPPPLASHAGRPLAQTRADPAVAALERTVANWLEKERGREPVLEELLDDGYENLRPCLPAGA